jgi:hypothetical protein
MSSRVTSLKDEGTYRNLIKLHLSEDPKHSALNWSTSDMERVVKTHEKFLEGVALTGLTINETMLTKCLTKHFECNASVCKEFAQKIAQALSWCRGKCKPGRYSSGIKTSPPVQCVMSAIKSCQPESPCPQSQTESPESPVDLCGPDEDLCASQSEDLYQGSEAMEGFRKLQEAFGEEVTSNTACSSRTVLPCPSSPMSIASSSRIGSPAGKMGVAAEVLPNKVFVFFENKNGQS